MTVIWISVLLPFFNRDEKDKSSILWSQGGKLMKVGSNLSVQSFVDLYFPNSYRHIIKIKDKSIALYLQTTSAGHWKNKTDLCAYLQLIKYPDFCVYFSSITSFAQNI